MINLLTKKIEKKQLKIAVIGLGYVGLPIAEAFSKYFSVIGFDLDKKRISDLQNNFDRNNLDSSKKKFSKKIIFTSKISELSSSDFFIITVPTPIKKKNVPNLNFLDKAVNDLISLDLKGKFIVIESTVYPTLSKKYIKLIENRTKLKLNKDFFFGFSPERINPGDNLNTLKNIDKIISCSSPSGLKILEKVYSKIINKIHLSKSIEDAEMAKIIENTQRDINIAFINEISIICQKLNLNFKNVLKLASTKWNFLRFTPGLVGGHCISVDPYYLTHLLKKNNYKPKVILSGRDLNESYPQYIFQFISKKFTSKKLKILIAGLAYKEDCNDTRNSKSFKLSKILRKKYTKVDLFDPNVLSKNLKIKHLLNKPKKNFYDLIILSVRHKVFFNKKHIILKKYGKKNCLIYDVKSGGYII